MNSLIKECSKCFEDKLMSDFFRQNATLDGRQIYCKTCHSKHCNKYQKEKRRNDSAFKKSSNLSELLTKCLKKKHKKSKLEKYLDCSLDTLYKWIEYQFTDEMNWSNYGSYWEIDHILPKSNFNHCDEEELMLCWGFRNLRPCTKTENRTKGNKIDYQLYYDNVSLASEFLEANEQVEYDSSSDSDYDEDLINL